MWGSRYVREVGLLEVWRSGCAGKPAALAITVVRREHPGLALRSPLASGGENGSEAA